MQLIGPVSDDLVLCRRPVVDLVLEDVVASGGVAVLVKGDRSPCTSCEDTDTQEEDSDVAQVSPGNKPTSSSEGKRAVCSPRHRPHLSDETMRSV